MAGATSCAWHAAAAWPALSKTLLTKPPNTGIRKDGPKYAKYVTATANKMRVFRSVFGSLKNTEKNVFNSHVCVCVLMMMN